MIESIVAVLCLLGLGIYVVWDVYSKIRREIHHNNSCDSYTCNTPHKEGKE